MGAAAQGLPPDKDRLIVRQACLNAGAGIAAQLPDQAGLYRDSGSLAAAALNMAEQFEAWVFRPASGGGLSGRALELCLPTLVICYLTSRLAVEVEGVSLWTTWTKR